MGTAYWWMLDQAAAFRAQKPSVGLASTTEKIRQRAHELWTERTRSGVPGSAEQDWAFAEREVLTDHNRPISESPKQHAYPNRALVRKVQSKPCRTVWLD